MKVSWLVDGAKHLRRLESSPPPNVVPKHRQETISHRHVKIPKERRPHLRHVRSPKSRSCGSVTFSAVSTPRECADWSWQGVFFVVLFTCMLVISDTRNYPTKGKGQEEIGWNPSLVEAVCDERSQLRTEGWTSSVCLVKILTATNETLQCAHVARFFQILCCVCSEDIMTRRA